MEARLHLAAIVESSDDAILSENLEGVILSWNRAATRILGFTEAEAIGKSFSELIPSALWGDEKEIVQRLRAGERIAHNETTRISEAGQTMHLVSTISPLTDAAGAIVGFTRIIRDATERTRAEEALSEANRRLIDTQEQERGRIARELHDDIGQRLVVLGIKVAALSKDLETETSRIAWDVQALSHKLHPSWVELLGIAEGARRFCQDFGDQHKMTVDFEAKQIPDDLPSKITLSLFRVLQEALQNSAKHSGVRRCDVRLWEAEGAVHLAVSDRGVGFDVEKPEGSRGIGLVSMRERVKLVDGELSIESQPQHGATIHARVPFQSSQAAARC
jgi:PAS domain S-box-containing protein